MSDYDYLPVSNGSGDAPLMHILSPRSHGSTVFSVDSVVNVPTKFVATVGTILASGFLDPTTKNDFKGHISGSTLIIDAWEPGSADPSGGNTAGQVIIIKPNTGWSNRVASFIKNATGFGTPEAMTFGTVAATSVSATGGGTFGGDLITSGNFHVGAASVTTADGSNHIIPTKQVFTVTALAGAATLQVPSFTAWDGAACIVRIYSAAAQTLTVDTPYENVSGLSAPTTTVAGKWMVFGLMYNAAVTKWQILSITTEA